MPNFKSISFKMAVLQGGGQNLPSPCVCYPKDPMWNRVKKPEQNLIDVPPPPVVKTGTEPKRDIFEML